MSDLIVSIDVLIQFAFVHVAVTDGYTYVVHMFQQMEHAPLPDYAVLDCGDIIELRGQPILYMYDLQEGDINSLIVRF